jgi:hypothetical protein
MRMSRRTVLGRVSMLGLAAGLTIAVSPIVASADDEDAMEPGSPVAEKAAQNYSPDPKKFATAAPTPKVKVVTPKPVQRPQGYTVSPKTPVCRTGGPKQNCIG